MNYYAMRSLSLSFSPWTDISVLLISSFSIALTFTKHPSEHVPAPSSLWHGSMDVLVHPLCDGSGQAHLGHNKKKKTHGRTHFYLWQKKKKHLLRHVASIFLTLNAVNSINTMKMYGEQWLWICRIDTDRERRFDKALSVVLKPLMGRYSLCTQSSYNHSVQTPPYNLHWERNTGGDRRGSGISQIAVSQKPWWTR